MKINTWFFLVAWAVVLMVGLARDMPLALAAENKADSDGKMSSDTVEQYHGDVRRQYGQHDGVRRKYLMSPRSLGGVAGSSAEKRIFKFLKQEMPYILEYMEKLKAENPDEAITLLAEYEEDLFPWVLELIEIKRGSPAAYELEKQIIELDFKSERLGEQIDEAESDVLRVQMVAQLKAMIEQGFDLKQKLRRLEALLIERELMRLRNVIDTRETNRSIIIARRIQDLSGEANEYDW